MMVQHCQAFLKYENENENENKNENEMKINKNKNEVDIYTAHLYSTYIQLPAFSGPWMDITRTCLYMYRH